MNGETPAAEKPKRSRKRTGSGASEAERLVEAWLQTQGWTTHRAAATGFQKFQKKGGGTGFCVKSHDLYGCVDILAFRRIATPPPQAGTDTRETWAVQVTTRTGLTERRRKLEARAWPVTWRVSLVTHETTPDPAHRKRKKHYLRLQDLLNPETRLWSDPDALEINVPALEKHRRERAAAEKARKAAERG